MLSRRNIRIKVLQVLYMMDRDIEVSAEDGLQYYRASLDRSQDLYLFNLYILLSTTECAKEDAQKKLTKYLPSEEDKRFSARLYLNSSTQALVKEPDLQESFQKRQFQKLLDADIVRKFYRGFAKTPPYVPYVLESKSDEADREILLDLYKYLAKDEVFEETMDDHFPTWEDDKSLIVGAIKKTIKALPQSPELFRTFRPDYEAAVEFGEGLLQDVIDKQDEYEQRIGPALENWEIDRVAAIDMVLLKMAISEFLNCQTIPTKVTLNEYVELSKMYSTDKSKDFVNGILDKLMKDLQAEGLIEKKGRGLDE